jgi:hypothetical protein
MDEPPATLRYNACMVRPQFNLKDLFLAVFLIALGCGSLNAVSYSDPNWTAPLWLMIASPK